MSLDTEQLRGEMKGLLERLQNLPLLKRDEGQSGMAEEPYPAPEQRRLLDVLQLVLNIWKLTDPKTAESVGISFGLVDKLLTVKPGESAIVNVGCGSSQAQFLLERLLSPVPVREGSLQCGHWCPFPPPGHCCLMISTNLHQPTMSDSASS